MRITVSADTPFAAHQLLRGRSMENKTLVLKLFLDGLGVASDISTVSDRKRVQKAVYLGQLGGVDLGYRFSWYVKGPYSTELTKDYYALADELASGSSDYKGREFLPSVRDAMKRTAPLMKVPRNVSLREEDWLELLASYHFLSKVSRQDRDTVRRTLMNEKPHVSSYADTAEKVLAGHGFL